MNPIRRHGVKFLAPSLERGAGEGKPVLRERPRAAGARRGGRV